MPTFGVATLRKDRVGNSGCGRAPAATFQTQCKCRVVLLTTSLAAKPAPKPVLIAGHRTRSWWRAEILAKKGRVVAA